MKTLKVMVAMLFAVLFVLSAVYAHAAGVSLAWDASSTPEVTGYKVHYGTTATRVYTNHVDVGKVTAATLTLPAGMTYFFAVTAYAPYGESLYSNEISTMIPVGAPVQLRFTDTPTVAPLTP